MDWDDLRFFLAVVNTRTLNGAARALGVNHSTVFRRISRFEESLGTRLFDRLSDGYHLTSAGEALLPHAMSAGEEIDAFQLKVRGSEFQPKGTVRLTAPDNIAYTYLPGYLGSFYAAFPEIKIELVVGAESLDLSRREADLAVRATTRPPEHLVGRKVLESHWACYASPGYLEKHGLPESFNALTEHRLVGADGPLGRLPPFQIFDRDFADSIVINCSTLNAMSAMTEDGIAISALPNEQASNGLVRLFGCQPNYQTGIWLLTHPELRRTERIRLLSEHLYQSFRADARLEESILRRSGAM